MLTTSVDCEALRLDGLRCVSVIILIHSTSQVAARKPVSESLNSIMPSPSEPCSAMLLLPLLKDNAATLSSDLDSWLASCVMPRANGQERNSARAPRISGFVRSNAEKCVCSIPAKWGWSHGIRLSGHRGSPAPFCPNFSSVPASRVEVWS